MAHAQLAIAELFSDIFLRKYRVCTYHVTLQGRVYITIVIWEQRSEMRYRCVKFQYVGPLCSFIIHIFNIQSDSLPVVQTASRY